MPLPMKIPTNNLLQALKLLRADLSWRQGHSILEGNPRICVDGSIELETVDNLIGILDL